MALLLARGADVEARDDRSAGRLVCCALEPSHADSIRRHHRPFAAARSPDRCRCSRRMTADARAPGLRDAGRYCRACGRTPGNVHRVRLGSASAHRSEEQVAAQMARAAGRLTLAGLDRQAVRRFGRASLCGVQPKLTVVREHEPLHRFVRTCLEVEFRPVRGAVRFDASVVGRHVQVPGRRMAHGEQFVVRSGLAGVGGQRAFQIEARPEARHVHAVEFRLVQRVDQLNQRRGWWRSRLPALSCVVWALPSAAASNSIVTDA